MDDFHASFAADLSAIRSKSPVVLNLTNSVAMDLSANALLAVGASPIMAHAPEELEELVAICGAIVINIGTLDSAFVERATQLAKLAALNGKPVVLDPVGAGATRFRTRAARSLIETGAVSVVRGNASEVASVFGESSGTRGVDSVLTPDQVLSVARAGAKRAGLVVAVSGAVDQIVGVDRTAQVFNGTPLFTQVTAMGCTATALLGAFLAVNSSAFSAAVHAMGLMGVCGELAVAKTAGPASFRVAFIDEISSLNASNLGALRVELL